MTKQAKDALTPAGFRKLVRDDLARINARAIKDSERKKQFRAFRKVGRMLNRRFRDKPTYGDHTIKEFAKAIGRKQGWIYKVRDFAATFDEDSLDLLLKHAHGIRWQHVVRLLAVDDKEKRDDLLRRAAKSGWTPAELGRAIQDDVKKRKRGGGRPLAKPDPENLQAGLRQITEVTESWLRRYRQVWNVGDESPLGGLAKRTAGRTSKSAVHDLATTKKALEELAVAVQAAIDLVNAGSRPRKTVTRSKAKPKVSRRKKAK